MDDNSGLIVISSAIIVIIFCILFFGCTPAGIKMWNEWFGILQEADDESNYRKLKEVEDTCRAMISSYESDRLAYEQYAGTKHDNWAEEAKMRANKTASSYNNFILKNEYLWKDNVPADIKKKLDIIN